MVSFDVTPESRHLLKYGNTAFVSTGGKGHGTNLSKRIYTVEQLVTRQ